MYSGLSSMNDPKCNTSVDEGETASDNTPLSVWLGLIFLCMIMTYTPPMYKNVQQQREDIEQQEEEQGETEQTKEQKKLLEESEKDIAVRFHFIMCFASMYLAMVLTNWGYQQDTFNDSDVANLWINTIAQWITFGIYFYFLIAGAKGWRPTLEEIHAENEANGTELITEQQIEDKEDKEAEKQCNFENKEDTSLHCYSPGYSNDSNSPSSLKSESPYKFNDSNKSCSIDANKSRASDNSFEYNEDFLGKSNDLNIKNGEITEILRNGEPNGSRDDNCVFKTPIKTPSKMSNKRLRRLSSSSDSPSPKRLTSNKMPYQTNINYTRLVDHSGSIANGSTNPLAGHSFVKCQKVGSGKEYLNKNKEPGDPLSPILMNSRRSTRLKDGVVKSLFNKNGCDEDLMSNNTKNVGKCYPETKTIPVPGFHDSNLQARREEGMYAATNGDVLVDIDVNRPLVTQLTPRKKTHSYIERLRETTVEEKASNVQATCSALDSCDSGDSKMSAILSNALGLVPNMSSQVNMSKSNEHFLSNHEPSVSDQQSVNLPHTLIKTTNTLRARNFPGNDVQKMPIDIEVPTSEKSCNIKENRINKGVFAFDHTNEGNTDQMDEKKMSGLSPKVISSHRNKEIIIKTTNIGEKGSLLNSDELRRTQKNKVVNQGKIHKEPEHLKGTQKDKQTRKGLSTLVRSTSNNEINSTANDKWPSPEDVKKAYLELNLCPPTSPNDVR